MIPELRIRTPEDGEPARYTGIVAFDGRLGYSRTTNENAMYWSRSFRNFISQPSEQLLANNICYSPFGSASITPRFFFGDEYSVFKSVAETRAKESVVGLTVDLGNGTRKELTYDLDQTVAPGGTLKLPLSFLASRSATFNVKATCEYRVGKGSTQSYEFKKPWTGSIVVPRPEPFGNGKEEEFFSLILASDTDLGNRVDQYLVHVSKMDDKEWGAFLATTGEVKHLTDAIDIAMHTSDNASHRLAKQVIASVGGYLSLPTSNKDVISPWENELFALLCRYHPQAAAKIAAEEYLRDNDNLLSLCLCLDSARPHLLNYSKDLAHKLDGQEYLDNTDFVLAAVLKHPLCERELLKMTKMPSFEFQKLPLLVWSTTQLDNATVYGQLAKIIASPDLKSSTARSLFDALAKCKNDKLISQAIAFANRVKEKPEYVEAMIGCLHYFDEFPNRDMKSLLSSLTHYAQSSEVRMLSEKVLRKIR